MKYLILIIAITSISGKIHSQDLDAETVSRIIDSKNLVFKAQSASSARGTFIQLTSDYDLKLRSDSLVAFLPFFGRAYVAPISPDDNGIKFTSTNFSYSARKKKKGNYEITMKPSDVSAIQQVYLTVTSSGMSRLQVISLNRDVMSYNGYLMEGIPTPKKAF